MQNPSNFILLCFPDVMIINVQSFIVIICIDIPGNEG